jgi:hypothetical protein
MTIETMRSAMESAAAAAGAAEIPEEWRETAFRSALTALLSGGGSGGSSPAERRVAEQHDRHEPLDALSLRLKVDRDALADIVALGADGPELVVPSGRLAGSKMAATAEIALLVAAVRQGAGVDEDWTPVEAVRQVVGLYGKYDPPNFAKHIRGAGDSFSTRGKGKEMEIRLTRPGWERATQLIGRLGG